MRIVLDSSAILGGKDVEGELFTTPGVLHEVRKKGIDLRTEVMIEIKVKIVEPSEEALRTVEKVAKSTGDIARLSPVDLGVLALSLELHATLLSDDYSMQNTARQLRVEYRGVAIPEIRSEVHWRYRCSGCGKYWEEPTDICAVCGSKIKRTRVRVKGIEQRKE